jgi:NAD-dependent deacetylase
MDEQIRQLQQMIDESRFTLVITGAGISVASGIPSMHGLNLAETLQFASTTVLKMAPEHYYRVARHSFLDAIFENGPSLSHKKLAELEKKGKVQGIITTNLDNLHSLAGSKNVAEIQGSFAVNACLKCGKRNNDVNIWNQGKAPRCECGRLYACWPVYAHVGLYNDDVPKAQEWARKAELVIVVGAIGNYGGVYWNHIRSSAKIVQINPTHTQFDSCSFLNIRKKCDEVFAELE